MLTIMQDNGREVCRMAYELSCSAKLVIHIPQLKQWFMHNILYLTRLDLSCGLIFNVKVLAIMLYMDSPIPGSTLQDCLFLK